MTRDFPNRSHISSKGPDPLIRDSNTQPQSYVGHIPQIRRPHRFPPRLPRLRVGLQTTKTRRRWLTSRGRFVAFDSAEAPRVKHVADWLQQAGGRVQIGPT